MSMELYQGLGELESMTTTTTTTTSFVVSNDGDDPLLPPAAHASGSGVLVLNTHCEYPSVPNNAEHDGFAVMVHVKAPTVVTTAAPVDLVAVLDVGEGTAGAKLAEVKRAMAFAIDNILGPRDRLGVVAFSGGGARRVLRLTRMSDHGKAAAKTAVESLVGVASGGSAAGDGVRVRAGLDEAEKVLHAGRPRHDVVASVVLVSGGGNTGDCNDDVLALVPPFFRPDWGSGYPKTPVHTFLLGSDSFHDTAAAAAAMNEISEVTGGTFSFVEDHAVIQDAVARCVGGLASTVVQDAWINVETWCDDMVVNKVKSGRYKSGADDGGGCSEAAWVDVGELYADEERRFLLFLDAPAEDDDDADSTDDTRLDLVKVSCSYTDMATGQEVSVKDGFAEVLRPVDAPPTEVARCVEVERELLRVAAAEDMARARDAAERGDHDEAARILDARRESLSRSAPAVLSGDATCTAVAAELHQLSQRVSDEREYKKTGRACILASLSSHGLQRDSSSPVRFGCLGSSSVFATPTMRKMEKLMMRKQQEVPRLPPPALQKNGSKTGVPVGSRRLEARSESSAGVRRFSMLAKYRRLLLKR